MKSRNQLSGTYTVGLPPPIRDRFPAKGGRTGMIGYGMNRDLQREAEPNPRTTKIIRNIFKELHSAEFFYSYPPRTGELTPNLPTDKFRALRLCTRIGFPGYKPRARYQTIKPRESEDLTKSPGAFRFPRQNLR
jgi:hypothetical protein